VRRWAMFNLGQMIFTGVICFLLGALTIISIELIIIDVTLMKGKKKEDPDKEEWKGLP
jgi:hypothetical protein